MRLRRDGVALNFDLLTQKCNQVICVPRCTSDKRLAKIRQQILEISRKHETTTWIRDGRKDSSTDGRPKNISPPPVPTSGGGLKISARYSIAELIITINYHVYIKTPYHSWQLSWMALQWNHARQPPHLHHLASLPSCSRLDISIAVNVHIKQQEMTLVASLILGLWNWSVGDMMSSRHMIIGLAICVFFKLSICSQPSI